MTVRELIAKLESLVIEGKGDRTIVTHHADSMYPGNATGLEPLILENFMVGEFLLIDPWMSEEQAVDRVKKHPGAIQVITI